MYMYVYYIIESLVNSKSIQCYNKVGLLYGIHKLLSILIIFYYYNIILIIYDMIDATTLTKTKN